MVARTPFAIGYAGNYSISAGVEYWGMGGEAARNTSSPSGYQYIPPVAMDIGLLGIKLNSTGGTNRQVYLDNNGSNILSYTATNGDDGVVRGSDYIAVQDGDDLSMAITHTGSTWSANAIFGVAKNEGTPISIYSAESTGGFSFTLSNAARRVGVYGTLGIVATSSNNSQIEMKTDGSFIRGQVNVSANARTTDTTWTLYKNGSLTSMAVTIPAGQTGSFYDDTTVSYVSGDRFDWYIANGAGTEALTYAAAFLTAQTATGKQADVFSRPATTVARAGSATPSYVSIIGRAAFSNTESLKEFTFGFPCRVTNFRAFVTAAAGYDGTFTVRKNGADTALTFSVLTGQSGNFYDLSNSVDFEAGDTITIKGTGGVSTNITFSQLALTIEDLTPEPDAGGDDYIVFLRRRRRA